MATFYIKQNDLSPSISGILVDADGNAVDIQGASVAFHTSKAGTSKVNSAANNDQVGDGSDGSKGKVSYDWIAGDTDTAGTFNSEWEVTFASGASPETYPNHSHDKVVITRELA